MKFKLSSMILSLSTIVMVGCTMPSLSKKTDTNNGICQSEPKWVLNVPKKPNKIYGIGIAPQNFNGIAAQRKSAIAKAINEIASQLKTVVNSQTVSNTVMYDKNAHHSFNTTSFQTVNGESVSAKIIKSCQNPNNGYLYILMEADK